jgi:putative transposase
MMPPSEKIKLIDMQGSAVSIAQQCRMLNLSRSRLYYVPKGIPAEELEMMRLLDEFYIQDPTRGTRRMCNELRKHGFNIGRGRTRRLMQTMRLKTIYCRPRTTVIDPAQYKYPYLLRNLKIKRINQVWAMDISYIPMKTGYMYLLAIIDLKSRYIVGWSLSNTMETSWVNATLKEAFTTYGKPEIINTDQGSQFTSSEYVNFIKSQKTIQISMDGKGRAIDNVYIERFFRTIKYEKLYLQELSNGHQVEQACSEFINYYNLHRDHSSLQNKTPYQVYSLAA